MTESLYDKLAQVSVSHRRVDSFEWVMTQSAPNTPPTSDGTSFKPYSPPPERLVSSASLPVPNEHWSTGSASKRGKQQRGYFDWWSSPSLGNGNGYAMIPGDEEHNERCASTLRQSIAGPSISHLTQARTKEPGTSTTLSSSENDDRLQPSQELNALGIVFPDTPPPSPPTSKVLKTPQSYVAHIASPRTPAPRLPKRVTFSPVIDAVTLESFPDYNEQHSSPWGSYLPSSFLVARPALHRTSSLPVTKATTVIRPILRRSTPSEVQPTRTTEMVRLSPRTDSKDTTTVNSPLPAQRLLLAKAHGTEHKDLGRASSEADKAFVSLLQEPHKASWRRCDSLLSNVSSSGGGEIQTL